MNRPPPPPPVTMNNNHSPTFQPGSKKQARWFATVQENDVVTKGTTVGGRSAGQSDPMAVYVSKYLVLYAVPQTTIKQFIRRQILPYQALSGSFRFTVPYNGIKPNTPEAVVCSNFRDDVCQADYVTILRHTFEYITSHSQYKSTFPSQYKESYLPMFVPFEGGRIRWNSESTYSSEQLLALKQDEINLVVIALCVTVLMLVFYVVHLRRELQHKNRSKPP